MTEYASIGSINSGTLKMITVSRSDFRREVIPDPDPDTSYLEQEGWEDRLRQYRNGDFGFIGIRAAIDLVIPYGPNGIIQTIESPGLWGIEDDSGEDYLNEVYAEERAMLAEMLTQLGVNVTNGEPVA